MNGGTHTSFNLGLLDAAWQIVSTGDYDGDGKSDILWRHTSGSLMIWKIKGGMHTVLNPGAMATVWTLVE
jgi:hypothetical protein